MFLAGEEAWPIDIIASELSSARPSGDLAKTAFRSQGARGGFLGSAVPLRRPARRHGRAPPGEGGSMNKVALVMIWLAVLLVGCGGSLRGDASAGPNPGGGFYGAPNIDIGRINP